MARNRLDRHLQTAPFNRFGSIQRLGQERSGHASVEHVRHQLYVGRDTRTRANALIKMLTKPGLVYEHNLTNEIATLLTINRELPDSRYFPLLWDHGRLPDGRIFLIMSLFDEWPLATTIGPERMPWLVMEVVETARVGLAWRNHPGVAAFDERLQKVDALATMREAREVAVLPFHEHAREHQDVRQKLRLAVGEPEAAHDFDSERTDALIALGEGPSDHT